MRLDYSTILDNSTLTIYDLRKKIRQIQRELDELNKPEDMPELVNSANLLRANEYLTKSDEKKTELLSAFEAYSVMLEKSLLSVFEIQNDMKEILKK